MKHIVRAAFASVVLTSLFATAPVHAQGVSVGVGICIPLVSCGNNGGAASAPEISGSMLSTGVGLISGIALMVRNRRRSSR